MRIDYSEPKKSYVTAHGTARPRKEPTGYFKTALVVTGIITFMAGFGTGWFLSQKSAKKSFQAATEQISLESSPNNGAAQLPKPPAPPQPNPQPPAQQDPAAAQSQPPPATPPGTVAEQPLSFYKTLPSGQKGNVLGSGINTKDDKAKQPLQAPIPSNLTRPAPAEPAKTTADKQTARPADNSYTVQVASYALKSEAETLKNTLSGKGYNAFISESHQGDKGTWYRVRVGRKMDQDAAKELARKLGKSAQVFPEKE
ncbi:MAG: SPOR domain-containing protein [Geobacteraceae bacterium]|nr:SPOR domain-containing protein [Geobacteraceae bacterium]